MSAINSKQTPSTSRPESGADVQTFKQTITHIDQTSQEAFDLIELFSDLLICASESSKFHTNPRLLRNALQAIHSIAGDAQNTINCLAEDVGCNYSESSPLVFDRFPQVVEPLTSRAEV